MLELLGGLHPITIHFPLSLLTLGWLLGLIHPWIKNPSVQSSLKAASLWNFRFGTVSLLPAIATGWAAYFTVAHDAPSHAAMTLHRNLALVTVTAFVVLGLTAWLRRETEWINQWPFRVGFLLAVVILVATGYRGGLLVYTHGLGVRSLPAKEEGEGHSHGSPAHAHQGPSSLSPSDKKPEGRPSPSPSPNPHPHDGTPHKH